MLLEAGEVMQGDKFVREIQGCKILPRNMSNMEECLCLFNDVQHSGLHSKHF